MSYDTITLELADDHVATVTLNRPQRMNAFNDVMMQELHDLWAQMQQDDNVHAIFLRAAAGRAFCSGIDVRELEALPGNRWSVTDPGQRISPKVNRCWKPVVAAVHGIAAGGAFYLLNECDLIICSEEATFFDPHVTYGMTSACEPIGMSYRMHLGDVLRMALLGNDERIGARSALAKGIVSEVLSSQEELWQRGRGLAAKIAAKPAAATQGTVKAIWESLDVPRSSALRLGINYPLIGNDRGTSEVNREQVMAAVKRFDVI